MNTNKKSLVSSSSKKKRILMSCAFGGIAVLMAGTGIGIGYAIFHSNKETPIVYDSIDDVVVTSNVINDKQTHLEKENDIMHFKFTLKNAMLGKTNLSINVNSEYENYFSGQGKILSFTSSDGTPINNVSTEIYVYFEPGEISKDIYIKQTATNTLSNDGYAVVSLEIYANYEDSNGNDDGKPIEENCSIYLYKDSEPVNTAPMVTNLLVKFQDAFDGGKFVNNSPLDFSVLCNYIGETFTNLPKLDNDKIVFNLDDNFNTVLGTLKCYDNAESMASTIISDYALSISGTDKDHYDSWKNTYVRLYNINVSTDGVPSSNSKTKFDMYFSETGTAIPDEWENVIFHAMNKNIDDDYKITWDSVYKIGDKKGNEYLNQQGTFVGWLQAKNSSEQLGAYGKQLIKTIYGGLVSSWPSDWN